MIIKLLSNGGYDRINKCVGKQFYAKKTLTGGGVEVDMAALNAEGAVLSKDDIAFCQGKLFFTNQWQEEYKVVKGICP